MTTFSNKEYSTATPLDQAGSTSGDNGQGAAPRPPAPAAVTLIRAISPANVGKTYKLVDGKLKKHANANVWKGEGETVICNTAQEMAALLGRVTSSSNLVLVNGVFRGAGTEKFTILTNKKFAEVVTADGGDYEKIMAVGMLYRPRSGFYEGRLVGARKMALQEPSAWVLLDADEPKGFRDDWRGLTFQQRLELLEPYAPGLSTAERVELRGSSARVIRKGDLPGVASHGWVRVDNPDDVSRAAIALQIHATNGGTAFESPVHDTKTGEQTATTPRTSIDLAPWHHGRLNFDSQPTINAEGYELADASITIVNEGGGVFRTSGVVVVEDTARRQYRKKTGHTIHVNSRGTGAMLVVAGQLKPDTPINVEGEVLTLEAWAQHMTDHAIEHLRCEAPFRDSSSESSFIGWARSGPFVYDIGVFTKYTLGEANSADPFDVLGSVLSFDASSDMDEENEDGDDDGSAAAAEPGGGPTGSSARADEDFASLSEANPDEDDAAGEDGTGEGGSKKEVTDEYRTFDEAIEALKLDKTNRKAIDAALRFYSAMDALDQHLAEERIVNTTGYPRRTLRRYGAEIKDATNSAADWTHSELANHFLRVMKKRAMMPVANSGALYIYAKETGIWRRKETSDVRAVIGRRYRESSNCKKHSDYVGVANTLMAEVADEDFFTSAPPGIATKESLWRANLADRKVERVPHHHDNRARFAVQFEPVLDNPPAEFIATLRQAFMTAPDLDTLAASLGYRGNIEHWPKAAPAAYEAALAADKADQAARAAEQVELLRQMMGATLLGFQHRMQLAVMLHGAANSFKSGCLRILNLMFEPQAVASVTPSELDSDYKRATLAHKRLNSVPELDPDTPIPAAAFKSIVGEDLVGARLPYGVPFSFVNEAAFWTAGNHFPSTRDHTDAFFRRWIVIHFKVGRQRGEVDPGLEPRLVANEIPAIAGWALQGAQTLLNNNMRPTLSRDHVDTMNRWRLENNSVASWLADNPEDSGVEPVAIGRAPIRLAEAHTRYSNWCRGALRKPFGRNTFAGEMARLGHPTKHTETAGNVFVGLAARTYSYP